MDINLRLLRYFLAVASSLNFSRAADTLHIAQSTLSQQIQQLEETYGVHLFERTGRSVSLTPAGLALQESASQLLNEHDRMCDQLRSVAQGKVQEVRHLHIFFDGHMIRDADMIQDIVGALREVQEEVSPRVAVSVNLQSRSMDDPISELPDVLGNTQTDFWLLGLEAQPQHGDLVMETIYSDTYAVAISEAHPRYRPDLSAADLPELIGHSTLFLLQNRSRYINTILNSISDTITPPLRFEPSGDVVSLYVALGMGVAIVPWRISSCASMPGTHFIPLPDTHFYTIAAYRRGNSNPLLPLLLAHLKRRSEIC